MRYPGFVPTINLRLPVLSLTHFAHSYPSQTLLWLTIYQKPFPTHMHNWLLLYICRKNTYQSAVIRSISQCLAPKIRFTFTASETGSLSVVKDDTMIRSTGDICLYNICLYVNVEAYSMYILHSDDRIC